MFVVNLQHLQYRHPGQISDLLTDITFCVQHQSRLGLIGANGAGKSTLLRLLLGRLKPDAGNLRWAEGSKLGYLPQELSYQTDMTVTDYLWSLRPELARLQHAVEHYAEGDDAAVFDEFYQGGGYQFATEIEATLPRFGFTPEILTRPVAELSGGEKTKLGLARLLLAKANVLLLDEPSNHLDAKTLTWLEDYLSSINLPYILISHDRALLNRCVNEIVLLEHGTSKHYAGNYAFYQQQREQEQQQQLAQYEKQTQKLKQLQQAAVEREQWSRVKQKHSRSVTKTGRICKRDDGSLPASKERMTHTTAALRSRIKTQLEKAKVDKPFIQKQRGLTAGTGQRVANQFVLEVTSLTKAYTDKVLFQDLRFVVEQGSRLAITGANGSGKSTLLKILLGLEQADAGEIYWPPQVKVAYYAQEAENLNLQQSALDNCLAVCEDQTLIRTSLGQLFFPMTQLEVPMVKLSQGERSKLALVVLLLKPANVLLLDEPCNHLEIASREALEQALQRYPGTIVFVSHDRAFREGIMSDCIEI